MIVGLFQNPSSTTMLHDSVFKTKCCDPSRWEKKGGISTRGIRVTRIIGLYSRLLACVSLHNRSVCITQSQL